MPKRPPKKPWSVGLPLPPWAEGGKPHVPAPLPPPAQLLPSTVDFRPPERWRIERVSPDGKRELVTLAGKPWEGSYRDAGTECSRRRVAEPGVTFEPVPRAGRSSSPADAPLPNPFGLPRPRGQRCECGGPGVQERDGKWFCLKH